jgi:hypothetical protein
MAFSWLAGNISSIGTLNVSLSASFGAGAWIFAMCAEETSAGSITGISDTDGNQWGSFPQQTNGTHISQLFYTAQSNVSVNNKVTFTVSGTPSGSGQIAVDAYGGPGGDPASAPDTGSSSTSGVQASPGPQLVVSSLPFEMLYCAVDAGTTGHSFTAGDGFVLREGASAARIATQDILNLQSGNYTPSIGGSGGSALAWFEWAIARRSIAGPRPIIVTGNIFKLLGLQPRNISSGTIRFSLVPPSRQVITPSSGAYPPLQVDAPVNPDGSFSVTLLSNDGISPAGSLYRVDFLIPDIAVGPLFYSVYVATTVGVSTLNLNKAVPVTPLGAS